MKTEYGVPVPRGVRKDWDVSSMTLNSGGHYLRNKHVPAEWGDPTKCVAWFDRFGRARVCVGHYANGRAALVRIDANNVWRTSFGQVPASVDTRPKDEDALAASLASGAVPNEDSADAQRDQS